MIIYEWHWFFQRLNGFDGIELQGWYANFIILWWRSPYLVEFTAQAVKEFRSFDSIRPISSIHLFEVPILQTFL